MSIIIRNLGGNMLGLCEYEIRINDQRITTFKHNRTTGLKACLLAAAEAVEAQQWQDAFALERSVRRNTREVSGEPKGGLKSLGSAEQAVPSGAVPIEPSPLCHGIGLKSSATRQGGREPETRADAKAGAVLEVKP